MLKLEVFAQNFGIVRRGNLHSFFNIHQMLSEYKKGVQAQLFKLNWPETFVQVVEEVLQDESYVVTDSQVFLSTWECCRVVFNKLDK